MEKPIGKKAEELRMMCAREIPIFQERANNTVNSLLKSLQSVQISAQRTAQDQAKLGQLKAQLRGSEDDLVKALAVKTRKEAKRMALADSISATKARIEELNKTLHDQRERKDEYASILSRQLLALETLEGKANEGNEDKEEFMKAISWYNEVLGFRIEGGHGVKFIFNKINLKDPEEEYSFTVRHANDTYSLLDCNPSLADTKALMQEMNQTNGLFKFVRIMREKFQAVATTGASSQQTSVCEDLCTVSISAPTLSISAGGSESPGEENGIMSEHDRNLKKISHGRVGKSPILSPGSASSLRRSSRLKVTK
ncbi:hypothetical protein Syun_020479 [Stephania yunnanensis]|uniref:Kinetochore protein SPC25 n=1 Tax=Stephania yunnanensis TaxID=152371 RepID=A0AAP0IEB1_9MAGN